VSLPAVTRARAAEEPLMKAAELAALGVFVVVAAAGVCNDKRTDCANWAREGECTGENQVCGKRITGGTEATSSARAEHPHAAPGPPQI